MTQGGGRVRSYVMKRRLILMRHAKSSWGSEADTDHDRPLNARGKRDAPAIAERLEAMGWVPDAVYSSTSKRTRSTWKRMAAVLPDGKAIPVVWEPDFYHGDSRAIGLSAASWPDGVETILVLGHNPGWEDALALLSEVETLMTTGNAALLEGRGESWVDAFRAPWSLTELLRPREL